MPESIPVQLRFPPVAGLTVRGDFDGGAISSDFGPLILRGVDRQIGLTERLTAAFDDQRHPSYITHPLCDLFAQRIYQTRGWRTRPPPRTFTASPRRMSISSSPVMPRPPVSSCWTWIMPRTPPTASRSSVSTTTTTWSGSEVMSPPPRYPTN